MYKLIKILSLLILTGCAVSRTPVKIDTVTITHTVIRDSIVTMPADSAFIRAWFECDSLNQVIMTELESNAGTTVKPFTTFSNGLITVTAKVDSQAVYLEWKERFDSITINTETIKEIMVEKVVYKKPAWLLWLSGLGAGAIVFLIILIILKLKI